MRCKPPAVIFEAIERRVLMASISGTVFNDLDNNGLRNGEPGLPGRSVYLDLNRNKVLNDGEPTAVTDADGLYAFSNVAPGNYSVVQVVPPGWQQTSPGSAPPGFAAPVAGIQNGLIPISRAARDSDLVKSALARVSNLTSYTRAQLESAKSWVVGLPQGATIGNLVGKLGAASVVASPLLADTYVLGFSARTLGTTIASRLRSVAASLSFYYPLIGAQRSPRAIPNDPLFANQWHLLNTGQTAGTPGADANVTSVWDTYKGNGVTIAIVDDGVEYTHEDLAGNYSAALSYDYVDGDGDPAPGSGEAHATAVAGVAAGKGFNSLGISGAAPNATLASVRLYDADSLPTDAQEASSVSHMASAISIYNNSWGPLDLGNDLGGPGPLTAAALQNNTVTGRNGLGSVTVWAAGNGRLRNDDVNYDGYANSRYVIAASAIDHKGIQSLYSEPGAPILVAAYSDGSAGITTTDRAGAEGYNSSGSYTFSFGGTSSASPLVAGVVALMLEANPNLGWRDVQHILAHSARKNHASDPGWATNGAGMPVNHKYGFGAIDAAPAVALAENWTNVGPEQQITSGTLNVNTFIPDNGSLTRTFQVNSDLRVESVEVVFNAIHTNRGQLKLLLTSPSGTQSILSDFHADSNDNWDNWVLTTKRNWDESAKGTWTLQVLDGPLANSGVWNSWKLNIYGTTPDTSVHYVVVNAPDAVTGKDFGAHDIVPPSIASSLFNFQTGHSITVQFSEDVSGSLDASDLVLDDLTRASTVPSASIAVTWNGAINTATFTFPGLAGGILPNGNYHATLPAAAILDLSGNALLGSGQVDFFVLAGDADRDRDVDVDDLGALASNWQQSPRDFATGDFDYSGTVDVNDLGILASNWQATLPAPSAPLSIPAPLAGESTRSSSERIAEQVL
jgi:subtilisin family serine protease